MHCFCWTSRPGAVPRAFGSTSASRGTSACRSLFGVIVMPMLRNFERMSSRIASSSTSGRPSTRAKTFRVMSSSVGPSPPVAMTTSERFVASRTAPSSRISSSPTIVFSFTSMPMALSCSVSQSEFVSTRSGVSISEPMAMISAFIARTLRPA